MIPIKSKSKSSIVSGGTKRKSIRPQGQDRDIGLINPNRLKIIAGSAKGMKIESPDVYLRPMMAKVREALFSTLEYMDIFTSSNTRVLDIFSGSGSVGLEALSRGAAHTTFIDFSPECIEISLKNSQRLGFENKSKGVCCKAQDILSTPEKFNILEPYQLITLTPPYEEGIDNIRSDMDIPTNTLIGQYGHCTQELINLLLTGVASSNVQDGNSSFDGSAEILKGIEKSPKIGYLTHLESLRLCQVGRYYKVPELPIWVVGGSSHFSVLFSQDRKCNEETKDEKIFYDLLRVFQLYDSDRCGFITSSSLQKILFEIGLVDLCNNDIDLARLRGHLQVDGEIIIWSTFWVNISKLLSGESLDSLITIDFDKIAGDISNEPIRFRSDSDVARELQAEYDNNQNNSNLFKPINNNPINNKSSNSLKRERSDSDVARELQAKWANEDNDNIYNLDFEQSGPETVTKLQYNDEIANDHPETISTITIGVPVFSDNQEMLSGSNICPIEEVIRTRWPGATIDWLGNEIPSID
eukprot:gene17029-22535_t